MRMEVCRWRVGNHMVVLLTSHPLTQLACFPTSCDASAAVDMRHPTRKCITSKTLYLLSKHPIRPLLVGILEWMVWERPIYYSCAIIDCSHTTELNNQHELLQT